MIKVYIASPYTKPEGEQEKNTRISFNYAEVLIKAGFAPYSPLWMHYFHSQPDYEVCMKLDFEWLKACDCLLRLSGESSGADREVAEAERLGIPVFYSIDDLIEFQEKL